MITPSHSPLASILTKRTWFVNGYSATGNCRSPHITGDVLWPQIGAVSAWNGRLRTKSGRDERQPDKVKGLPCMSISGECLVMCPPKPFREIVESFSSAKISNPQHRQLARDLFANTENCRVDTAGRMLLTARSRKCAGILSELVLVGTGGILRFGQKKGFPPSAGTKRGNR